jgi:hypothetical protein
MGCWTLTTALSASGCIDLGSTISGATLTKQQLGREEGTIEGKAATEQGSETINTNKLSTYDILYAAVFNSPRATRLRHIEVVVMCFLAVKSTV